jgi:hypothetical protein
MAGRIDVVRPRRHGRRRSPRWPEVPALVEESRLAGMRVRWHIDVPGDAVATRLVAALGALPRSSIFLSVGHSSTMRTSSVAAALAAARTVTSVCLGCRASSPSRRRSRCSDCSDQRSSEAGQPFAGLLFQLTM